MRILLISPKKDFPDVGRGWLRVPQLILPVLKALTPSEHEVLTVDEEYEPVPLDEHWDVVGITVMTPTAARAYELASLMQRNGSKVILGGVHASVLPHEAAQFADSVVVGEAEGVWQELLDDARRNRLKRFYSNWQPDLSESPLPARKKRRSLFGSAPFVMSIMASRGCPFDCEFCCSNKLYGHKQRHVPIEHIVEDIERNGAKRIAFLDNNIGGVRSYALRLFAALEPLNVTWSAMSTPGFILDNELFDAALRSGLKGLYVGVESVESEARKKMPKALLSIQLYEKAIQRCRSAGIVFHASLVFGLDEETPHVFERTLEFLLRNSVPTISPCILTPYPGTRLFERLMGERRILHTNWSYYEQTSVCYQPKNMEPEELAEKYLDFRDKFFSCSSMMHRAYAQLSVAPAIYLGINLAYRKRTKLLKQYFRNYFEWLRQQDGVPKIQGIQASPVRTATGQA